MSDLSDATAISAGFDYTCALVSDGAAKCWGVDLSGALGDGIPSNGLKGSIIPLAVAGLTGATAISAGGLHSCALLSSGTVLCWGYKKDGEIGDGTTTTRLTPVAVEL